MLNLIFFTELERKYNIWESMLTKLEEKLSLRLGDASGSNILDKNLERRALFFRQTLRS